MRNWVGCAKVPFEAGRVISIQVYYDKINEKKTVLVCEHGNWVYDARLNAIVPLIGRQDKIVVQGDRISRIKK